MKPEWIASFDLERLAVFQEAFQREFPTHMNMITTQSGTVEMHVLPPLDDEERIRWQKIVADLEREQAPPPPSVEPPTA